MFLDTVKAQRYLDRALARGGDFAELFEEEKWTCSVSMLNGKIEAANSGERWGLSIRIFDGLRTVYGYTNEQDDEKIMAVIDQLAESIGRKRQAECRLLQPQEIVDQHAPEIPVQSVTLKQRRQLMQRANDALLSYDPVIKKAMVNLADEDQTVIIASSEGKFVRDNRQRTRMRMQAVAVEGDRMQNSAKAPGAHAGYEFYDQIDIEAMAQDAARTAKVMLNADECPSGEMTVVIDNGFGGVIFHEACGHSLEATSVAYGNSVFCGKLGQKVASELVNAVDDGTIPHAWGSNNIDDEGYPCRRNLLIENGILKGYLIDPLNARRMEMEATGSSRRQDYTFEPTSRMTNTFLLNGTSTVEEIIADTSLGLYAKRLGGGSVNPVTGDFNFAVLEAYMIRGGQIAEPVRGATLIGNGAEILFKIDKIADNGSREQGMCGSKSGSIPTDVGQPTIRVRSMTVGGKGGKLK
ncbi:TldD/PmbA family protein [Holdemania massiliensis]|uniref:TldD/PmbA family protein n=1 Tax=Holdemania massiliensis TaxID=1468449 RepID=UPI003569D8FC